MRDYGHSFIKIGTRLLYSKTSPVVKHQFVHIDYMRAKKDMHFNRILEACDLHGITDLL
jgi:hypothetical protein